MHMEIKHFDGSKHFINMNGTIQRTNYFLQSTARKLNLVKNIGNLSEKNVLNKSP